MLSICLKIINPLGLWWRHLDLHRFRWFDNPRCAQEKASMHDSPALEKSHQGIKTAARVVRDVVIHKTVC